MFMEVLSSEFNEEMKIFSFLNIPNFFGLYPFDCSNTLILTKEITR
jgi:hypothetical protein